MDYVTILEAMRANVSARALQERGLVSRNKAAEIRATVEPLGWLEPSQSMPTPEEVRRVLFQEPPLPVVTSRVEPYSMLVDQFVKDGLAPTQIFRKLRNERGYEGSVGAIKRFIKRINKGKPPKAYMVLTFEPGEAAQVDFGTGPMMEHPVTKKPTRTQIFVMTLCHSRHMYAELVWDQTVETWLKCHKNAFLFFGGVPERVILDNLKAAILKACQDDPIVQKSYEDAARAWGFQIDPCKPRTPWHKGRVERGVGFVKEAFLAIREFRNGIGRANQELLEWVLGEAGNRIHGTTHEMPLRAFAEREKAALKALPSEIPEIVFWAKSKLQHNCLLTLNKTYYSAPFRYINQELDIRVGEKLVEVSLDHQIVAVHPRNPRPGAISKNDEHYPPHKVAYMMKTPCWCLKKAAEFGPNCHAFMMKLLGDKVLDRLRGAIGVLRLGDKHGSKRLEEACARALAYETFSYRVVKNILDKGLDQAPKQPDNTGQLHFDFPESPRFSRNIGQLLWEAV